MNSDSFFIDIRIGTVLALRPCPVEQDIECDWKRGADRGSATRSNVDRSQAGILLRWLATRGLLRVADPRSVVLRVSQTGHSDIDARGNILMLTSVSEKNSGVG